MVEDEHNERQVGFHGLPFGLILPVRSIAGTRGRLVVARRQGQHLEAASLCEHDLRVVARKSRECAARCQLLGIGRYRL